MSIDKYALKESLSDVALGLVIALPLSFSILTLCQYYELSIFLTSIAQTILFTIVAVVRKYYMRIIFKRGGKNE